MMRKSSLSFLAACSLTTSMLGCSTNVDLAGVRQKTNDTGGGTSTPASGDASTGGASTTTPSAGGVSTMTSGTGGASNGGATTAEAGSAGAPADGGCQNDGELPLDLYVMYDQSSSLNANVDQSNPATTWWAAASDGMVALVNNPRLVGTGVGIQFFPFEGSIEGSDPSSPSSSCYVPNYVTPEVEIAPLPGNAASIVNALRAHSPTTFTPTAPALKGAIEHMKGWGAAHPGRRPAVVLVTDGYPTECTPQAIADIAQIAAEGYASTPRVLTYVVGLVSGGSLDNMNGIAAAGGTGRTHAVVAPDVASRLESAMLDIGTTPACTPSGNGCGAGCGPIEFRAGHDPSGGPLIIEPGTETEICFGFHVDGTTLRQVTTATPLLDDTSVVHDMALFQMNAPEVNGSAQSCPRVTSTAPPPGGTLVWSWLPPTRGPGPVSFDIPPGDFELAVHYMNIDAFPHWNDTSGASVCACGI